MSYLGESGCFSFRDNFCEALSNSVTDTSSFSALGRKSACVFRRFTVSCADEKLRHLMYAFSAGASENGADIFICENAPLPALKSGIALSASDCGVFISGSRIPRAYFFGENSFPMAENRLKEIIDAPDSVHGYAVGKIQFNPTLRSIYVNSIKDCLKELTLPLPAGISCGNKEIRLLWREFFSDADDTLILQVSDDGQKVNAYSTELGFISYDRLILAYALKLWKNSVTVWLPDNFHFAAENTAKKLGYSLKRYNPAEALPTEAAAQRFFNDPLFLCTELLRDINSFLEAASAVPEFTSARRELDIELGEGAPFGKSIVEPDGRIILTKSGKGRISLIAQAYDTETAAEMCAGWSEKLRKLSSCNNLFHSDL